jgi:ubiquinol-cytochrome c reductase cytochrome b subunit
MIARMFFGHEYKKRHDFVWVMTLIFAQLAIFFQLTGHILPWDTNAAATANVEAGFSANIWAIGPYIKRFLLGGSAVGGDTLTRWYGFHALLFPLALLALVGLPLLAYRLRRPDDPGCLDDPELNNSSAGPTVRTAEAYYPVHLAREMIVAAAVFLVVAAIAWYGKAPLELEATADNLAGYQAYSEWYVLPLHALTLLPPFNNVTFEPLATIVIPGAIFTILIALPFLYRIPNRPVITKPIVPIMGATIILVAAGLYAYAFSKERPYAQKQIERIAILKGEKQILLDTNLVAEGKSVYAEQSCNGCHAIAGKGGKVGTDLTRAGLLHPDRDWQIKHLTKPDAEVPGSTMPPYGHLKQNELRALAEYMLSLR